MPRKLTKEEQTRLDLLKAEEARIKEQMDAITNKPTIYGYMRVSSRKQEKEGHSLEAQESELRAAGAEVMYKDVFTGTKTSRPQLDLLLQEIRPGDTIIVTKLDRIARSVQQGIALIESLVEKGITVRVLNMGTLDNTPTGKLTRNIMLAFAEFERDMIMERTRAGKETARKNPAYREGRKKTYTQEQIRHAMELLNGNSYTVVSQMTGISKSTLIRARKKERNNE